MQLSVHERLRLLEILPKTESYAGVKEVYRASMLLSLTEEEALELEVVILEDGSFQMNNDKALKLNADIPIGEYLTNIIRQILKTKDETKDLNIVEMSLFEKFIMDYE